MNKELLYQNKKIFYRIIGDGKPIILIHGFGEDSSVWENQIRPPQTPPQEGLQTPLWGNSLLNNKFKFIIPDLPGSGQSEMIDDMSMEGMAELVKTILIKEVSQVSPSGVPEQSEGKERSSLEGACPVIGHSMGGYITLALVEKYPELVSAFGLFHSSAYADSEEKKATRRKGIEFIKQHGAFEFLKTAIPNLFSQRSKDEMPERIAEFLEQQNNFSAAALVSYYEAMMARPDRTEMLRKATVPVLFIMGKYDNAIPIKDSLEQCHLPENSYIHILRQSGHMGMLEEPELTNESLEKFLSDI